METYGAASMMLWVFANAFRGSMEVGFWFSQVQRVLI